MGRGTLARDLEALLAAGEDPERVLVAWGRAGRLEEGVRRLRDSLARRGVGEGPELERFLGAIWRCGYGLGDPWLRFPDWIDHLRVSPAGDRIALATSRGAVAVLASPFLAEELAMETGGRLSWLGWCAGSLVFARAGAGIGRLEHWSWAPGARGADRTGVETAGLPDPQLVDVTADGSLGLVRSGSRLALVGLGPPVRRGMVPIDTAGLGLPGDSGLPHGEQFAWFSPDGGQLLLHWVAWAEPGSRGRSRYRWNSFSLHDTSTGVGRVLALSSRDEPEVDWDLGEGRIGVRCVEDRDAQDWAEHEYGVDPDPAVHRVALATGEILGVEPDPRPALPPAAPGPRIEGGDGYLLVDPQPAFPRGVRPCFHRGEIEQLAWVERGAKVLSRDRDREIVVWDAGTGLPAACFELEASEELHFSAGSGFALRGSRFDGSWTRFELSRPEARVRLPPIEGLPGRAEASALSPDGGRQLLATAGGRIVARDLESPSALEEWEPASPRRGGKLSQLGFGPDGTWIWVLTSQPTAIEIGPAAPGSPRKRLLLEAFRHTGELQVLALPGRPRCLVLGDSHLVLADGRARRVTTLVEPPGFAYPPLAVSPDGRRLVLGGARGFPSCFHLDPARPRIAEAAPPIRLEPGPRTLAFCPTGARILHARGGLLRLMDWPGGEPP